MNNNIFFILCHQDDEFGLFNVIEKFTAEYQDRLPTAFTNLNTI